MVIPINERVEGSVPVIGNLHDALVLFKENISSRKLEEVTLKGRRVGEILVRNATNEKYLILYKREKYLYFGRHFPDVPDGGQAIIANMKLVYHCALNDIKLVSIFPDGRAYGCDAMEFWKFYEIYQTEHPHLAGEIAYPFRLWARLF